MDLFGRKRRKAAREAAEREAQREELRGLIRDALQRKPPSESAYWRMRDLCRKVAPIKVDGVEYRAYDISQLADAWSRMEKDRYTIQSRYAATKRTSTSPLERLYELANLIGIYRTGRICHLNVSFLEVEFGDTVEQLRDRLKKETQSLYEQLVARRSEGEEVLAQLRSLILSTRKGRSLYGGRVDNALKAAGVDRLEYPEDWNHLVARAYSTPTLELFDLPSMNMNEVAQLGEEVRRQHDETAFTNAQVVLAFCRDPECRIHVGDILFTELVEVVNRYQAAAAVAADEPAETKS